MLYLKPLDDAINHIVRHPKEWDQGVYRSKNSDSPTGEVGCLAYHICKQVGAVFDAATPAESRFNSYYEVRHPDTWEKLLIPDYAQKAIGVADFASSMMLFYSWNSLDVLMDLQDRLHTFGDVMPAPVGVLSQLSAF